MQWWHNRSISSNGEWYMICFVWRICCRVKGSSWPVIAGIIWDVIYISWMDISWVPFVYLVVSLYYKFIQNRECSICTSLQISICFGNTVIPQNKWSNAWQQLQLTGSWRIHHSFLFPKQCLQYRCFTWSFKCSVPILSNPNSGKAQPPFTFQGVKKHRHEHTLRRCIYISL